ncbi:hypothetical protein FIBSPDRAFT_869194 [Athelia psychrophila]|uniref:Carbamoyl phosphate synthase ATP-binding domain-containing protein n=1 Tax=Athelia psychrophila TaxID=1759441 RepID=A0A166CCT3_9AGAM|nr:hypothetical protein FIBSPDRAFT_869194 [Fibularhizoctonia sp. CBS 109695]
MLRWHPLPSSTIPRNLIESLLATSTRMALESLRYQGVGAFEFLVNSHTSERVSPEINPRIQVKHAVIGVFLFPDSNSESQIPHATSD